MSVQKLIVVCFIGSILSTAASAECPNGQSNVDGHVSVIHYNTTEHKPTFKMQEFPGSDTVDTWMRLSNRYTSGDPEGKVMLSLLLAAKTGGFKMRAVCAGGQVEEVFIDYPN